MSNTTNQPTSQATTDLRARLERSLEVAGKPADRETINRIVSSSRHPQPTATRGGFQPKPFSLLR